MTNSARPICMESRNQLLASICSLATMTSCARKNLASICAVVAARNRASMESDAGNCLRLCTPTSRTSKVAHCKHYVSCFAPIAYIPLHLETISVDWISLADAVGMCMRGMNSLRGPCPLHKPSRKVVQRRSDVFEALASPAQETRLMITEVSKLGVRQLTLPLL